MRRLNYLWRLIGTGIAFPYVFFGGGILALLFRFIPFHSRERTQKYIRLFFRFYLRLLQFFGIISLEVIGAENLYRGGRMLIANHPSLLDVVILMAQIPNAQCIVKQQLWDHRLLGRLMRSAGYISNGLEGEQFVEQCKNSITKGQCLILFPEGTRTIPGQMPKFQRGFANLALYTQAPIQRVIISCNPPTLVKGERWWHIPPAKPHFKLIVEKPLDASYYNEYNKQNRGIAARHLVKDMENYYAEKIKNE